MHGQGADRQDHVAVDDLAVGGDRQATVRVAVVGDADVETQVPDGVGQRAQVGGTHAVVDVPAVGLAADGVHRGAGAAVHVGPGERGRAVGAVDHDVQSGERPVDGRQHVPGVVLRRVGQVPDAADLGSGGTVAAVEPTDDRALDGCLERVGELVAAPAEQLEAVVGHRVVAGRDHQAEVGVVPAGEVGERGRRDDAGEQHLGTGAGQPGHHRGLEHLPAGAGVTADDRDGTLRPVAVGEHSGCGARDREGQLRCEVGVGPAPDAVRAEQATQRTGQRLEY